MNRLINEQTDQRTDWINESIHTIAQSMHETDTMHGRDQYERVTIFPPFNRRFHHNVKGERFYEIL